MSSGRDEMMSNWKTDQEAEQEWLKKQIQRMTDYRLVLSTELDRLDNHIKEMTKRLQNGN